MHKKLCLLPALALALLCACSRAETKTPPTREAVTSTERQFTTRADGCLQFCGAGPQRILR